MNIVSDEKRQIFYFRQQKHIISLVRSLVTFLIFKVRKFLISTIEKPRLVSFIQLYQRWTSMRNNSRLWRRGIVQFRKWWKWWFLWIMPRKNWSTLRRFRIHHRSWNRWMQKCLCRRTKWVFQFCFSFNSRVTIRVLNAIFPFLALMKTVY